MTCVLIVDDHPAIRDAVRLILEEEGYCVALAADGQAALDRIAASPPDVVLTDLNMPAVPGWELPARIRALHLSIPVIFMSTATDLAALATAHGANAYIAKPFAIDALLVLLSGVTLSMRRVDTPNTNPAPRSCSRGGRA